MTDLERLKLYDEEISKEMPLDFRDFWENSKDEWPLVTRLVLEGRRENLEWCYDVIDKQTQKIKELEAELQEFKQQLDTYKETTLETAVPGDVLKDGSIVLQNSNGLALLVSPASTEVVCSWSKEFPEVFEKLRSQGFNSSQWFIPTQEQLNLAYENPEVRRNFSSACYWSSTEFNATGAYIQDFFDGSIFPYSKTNSVRVRAFRCVTY
jgi:hypothetical protein